VAISADNMSDAQVVLKSRRGLPEIFAAWPALGDAWSRGRRIRRVGELAGAAMSVPEAAQSMELSEAEFRDQLDSDPEIRDAWDQARIAVLVEIQKAVVTAARAGKSSAINHVLQVLRRGVAQRSIDFARLSVNQASDAIGKSRQTLHAWHKNHGSPRNADGTISLPELLVWWEAWIGSRSSPGPSSAVAHLDPLKAGKARKMELEFSIMTGELLDRGEVMAGLLARHQAFLSTFRRKATELSIVLHGAEPDRIRETLEKLLDDMRRQMLCVPEQLRLPDNLAANFVAILAALKTPEAA
jgi:hypothetical protein